MSFPTFTDDHYAAMRTVIRDYRGSRAVQLSPLTGDGDQLKFMRMCNAFAEKLEKVMPELAMDELQDLFIAMDKGIQFSPFGLPATFPDFTDEDQASCVELLGCLAGLRRMNSGG